MGTQVGNTIKSLGKEYNIASSNVGGDVLLNSYFLRENTLIVDAKIDNNLYDKGSYSLFITDGEGKAARLTYTIQPGNGLYIDNSDTDIVKMYIEGNSIKSEQGTGLYVDTANIIDNNTIQVYNDDIVPNRPNTGRFKVVTANLDKANNKRWGIIRPDENTTYIADFNESDQDLDDLRLMVNTQALETVHDGDDYYVTEETDEETGTVYNVYHGSKQRDGIIKHNSQMFRTIKASNGHLEVLTYNLDKADNGEDKWGVVKGDEHTINAIGGILSVDTQGLDYATNNSYGTVKVDDKTIKVADGIISVDTKNLEPATSYDYGVVMYDNWSIGINPDDKKLEVKKFQEIEAMLESNPKEHASIKEDIVDLTNRVIKLEIEAFSEKIEFLTPVGNATTELPEPVFDTDTWSIKNRYSEKKTIAFQIKTNCRYKVNVEYKGDSNQYNQVKLDTVQVGDSEIIPGNSLDETEFEETSKTVQTLYFTFDVKNYEADNNIASINTQVVFTATSINDAAIYQTSFHIFKCWNNKAYELDLPNFDSPSISPVNLSSYWVINEGTERIDVYGDLSQTSSINLGDTSSKNFYFNTYILASYFGNENEGNYLLNQSISDDLKQSITKDTLKIQCSNPNFKASLIGSYNSTKQYNVIKIESTTPLGDSSRNTDVTITLPEIAKTVTDPNLTSITWNTVDQEQDITKKYKAFLTLICNSVPDDGISNTGKFENISDNDLKNILIGLDTDQELNKKKIIANAKYDSYASSSKESPVVSSEIGLNAILKSDLIKLNEEYSDFIDFIEENNIVSTKNSKGVKPDHITDKSTYTTYWTFYNNVNDYITRIKTRIDNSRSLTDITYDHIVESNSHKELTFNYSEEINHISPSLDINFNVTNAGVSYTMSRNSGSYYDTNGTLSINYVFTNNKGDSVNAEGKPFNGTNYYNFNLPVSASSNLTKGQYKADFLTTATSGYRTESTTSYSYFNVIVIDGDVEDRNSAWPWSNRDIGYGYWGGYDSANKKSISSISDNINLVYRLKGRDAGYQGYYSLSWKGRSSGVYDYLAKSNWLCWEGLSKDSCWNTSSATISDNVKIGNNYYMTSDYAIAQLKNKGVDKNWSNLSRSEIAKLYYETFKSNLVYTTTQVPVKVANGITGMKIVSIDAKNAPDYKGSLPAVEYTISGLWQSTGGQSGFDNTKPYTFGNATISAINIDSWDDFEMTIKFTITGGSETNIPSDTQLSELKQSNNGSTKFTFLVGSKSYVDTQYYDSKSVTCSTWKNNKCTITYKLYNDYSLNKGGVYVYKSTTMYDKNSYTRKTVYLKTDTKAHTEDNLAGKLLSFIAPDLSVISGIKAWFGIQSTSVNLNLNFESSTSSNGVEIKFSDTAFSSTVSKNTAIVNALYNSTITVTTTPVATNTSTSTLSKQTKEKTVTITTNKLTNKIAANKITKLQK